MNLKRVIALTLIACMVLGMQGQLVGAKTLRKAGKYKINGMYSGKRQLSIGDFSKKEKKQAWKLYKKNIYKYYKKYKKNLWLKSGVVKTKYKNYKLTVWGKVKYKGKGIKKTYRLNKYKFILSKNVVGYGSTAYGLQKMSKKELFGLLKKPQGLWYELFVRDGKVYRINAIS